MKLFQFLCCLVMVCTLQWSSNQFYVKAASKDIYFPKNKSGYTYVDVDGDTEYLIVTRPQSDGDGGYLLNDYRLKNCRYNIDKNTINCEFKDIGDHQLTVNLKSKPYQDKEKSSCKLTEKTVFSKVVLSGRKPEDTLNELLSYEVVKNKIANLNINGRLFKFVTKDKCTFNAKISNISIVTKTKKN
ncbi:hypothetical protein BCR32DRAFT_270238 [Anaeromyces robustus]|uniref:Uncharacterized protein n=1 Tax=Anaeromyces robustus TaxID=1754192 RepID=A0A1Y1WX35_9FUNG|nr:hypothetical protein BCR32DRAFT_270238 [Anaeromyces robustus]|eukprot:ORX78111.1 hypothetical protein BCR32DRAFT_270238 [Anaeromyces robustus]